MSGHDPLQVDHSALDELHITSRQTLPSSSPRLFPLRDDGRIRLTQAEFLALAWKLANDMALDCSSRRLTIRQGFED
jgi:hypothetical protein